MPSYSPRSLKDVCLRISRQFPVLLLTGPRQAGKTTFLQHICEKHRAYITLDDPSIRSLANEDPALFMERFSPPILIDEIQYAQGLMSYIKMAVDTNKSPGQFWLTGSQHFLMMKDLTDSLAGRVVILNLLGFSRREKDRLKINLPPFLPVPRALKKRVEHSNKTGLKKIYRDIWLGSFPALATGRVKNKDYFYSSYIQSYLQRDVRDLTQVGNELSFMKFIRACAGRTAQILNLSDLARDADISVPTAKNWLSILEASFQVFLLQPYHSNITKRLIKRPKLYFLDTGLCSYLTGWSSPEVLEAGAMSGAIFETHVFSEILKSYWHRGIQPTIYYYRDKDDREIDFLITQDQEFYPVEVKKSATPKRQWISHFGALKKFKKKVGGGAVICMTSRLLPLDDKTTVISVGCI